MFSPPSQLNTQLDEVLAGLNRAITLRSHLRGVLSANDGYDLGRYAEQVEQLKDLAQRLIGFDADDDAEVV
jgi:hypothetical protein